MVYTPKALPSAFWSVVSHADTSEAVPHPRLELSFPHDPARLLRVRERIRDYLDHLALDEESIDEVILAIMEAATNALRHSGGAAGIGIRISVEDGQLVACVSDDGRGFDLAAHRPDEPPDVVSSGGRGLFLIGELMDSVEFLFDTGTEVRMRKSVRVKPGPPPRGSARAVSPDRAHERLTDGLVTMLARSDDCFVALDWEWRYLHVNSAAERRLRRGAGELLGRPLFTVFPDLRDTEFELHIGLAMEQGVVSHFEGHFEPWDVWDDVRVYPAPFGVAIYFRDISDRKRAERRAALDAVVLRGIAEILEAAADSASEEDLGQACLGIVEGLTQSAFGLIVEVRADGSSRSLAISGAGDVGGLPDAVVKSGETLLANEPGSYPASIGATRNHPGLGAFLGVPLRRAGQLFGVIAVGDRPGGYGDDQRSALEAIAPVVAQALDRVRSRASLLEAHARTRVLAAVAAAAAGTDHPRKVSEDVLAAVALHLGLKAGSVESLAEGRRELQRLATYGAGFRRPHARATIPPDERSGSDPGLRPRREGLGDDRRVEVQITAGEEVLGALTLVFPGRRFFLPDEVTYYRAIADLLGASLQRARSAAERERQRMLIERVAHLSRTLDAVNEVVRGVGEPLSAIARAAHLAADSLDVEVAAVCQYQEGCWRPVLGERGDSPAHPASELETSFVELVQKAMAPIAACRAGAGTEAESGGGRRSGSQLGAPLLAGGSVFGAIVFAAAESREYSAVEMDFVRDLGFALGGTLQNMQFYEELDAQLELSHLLLAASKVLTEWTDLDLMLERLAGVLLLTAPGSRASVVLLDLERQELRVAASKGIAPLPPGVYGLDQLPAAQQEQVRAPSTVVLDYDERPRERIRYPVDRFRPRFGLSVPVVSRGSLIGLLALEAPRSRHGFTSEEILAVEAIADQAATAIENARLFDAEVEAQRRARRELEISHVLLTTAEVFASQTDPQELLSTVARTLTRSFGQARVAIALSGGREEMTVAASAGEHAFKVGAAFAAADHAGPARRATRTGRATAIDYEALSEKDAAKSLREGMRIAIVAPLVTGGRTIGMLTIDQAYGRREFTARDIALAQGIAEQAAIAIHNASLLESEREEVRFGEALDEAGRLLHSTMDDDTILARALRSGGEALHAASGVISFADPSQWVVRYQFGFGVDVVGRAWTDEEVPFMAEARRLSEPVTIGDVTGDGRDRAGSSTPPGVRSVLTLPLTTGDEVVGVLVYNKMEAEAFSEPEVIFATRLARSVSLALQNARLFATEQTIADTLQEALLAVPDAISGFSFAHAYHSATVAARVGGDFLDVFELGDGVVGVVVGDVSGKGLDAAVMSSSVKNAIWAQTLERTKTPADVLRVVNEVLLRSSAPEVFASVFFGVLDGRDGRLTYCNAGHTPGLVVRLDGVVDLLPHTGPVLGAFPDLPFDVADTVLKPDELLFLYTDGLIEARGDGVLFGEPRLLELFGDPGMREASVAVGRAVKAVRSFAEGRLSDDLALLAIAPHAAGRRSERSGGRR